MAHILFEMGDCPASTGASVKHQSELMTIIRRDRVKDHVTPVCPVSPGTRHDVVDPTRQLSNLREVILRLSKELDRRRYRSAERP
jgi:hypothetical protein